MKMNVVSGASIAVAAAALLVSGASLTPAAAKSKKTAQVMCLGINSCKGKGACKSARNDCKGMNSCKGQGWLPSKSKGACTKAGGHVG